MGKSRYQLWLRNTLGPELLTLVSDSLFLFVCRVAGATLVLVTQILLARWMGPEQLGLYVYAFAWCIFLSVVAGCGFPTAAVRFIGKGIAQGRNDLVNGYFRRAQQIGLVLSLSVAACISLVLVCNESLRWGIGGSALFLAMLAIPVFTMTNVYASAALAMSWFRTAFLANVVIRPALLLAGVIIVWRSSHALSAESVMLLHIGFAVLVLLFLAVTVRRRVDKRFPRSGLTYESQLWIRTAPPLLVITLFLNYFQELNIIVAGWHLSADQLAVYNAGFRIAFLITFGIQAVNAIMMPRTAQLHAKEDRESLQRVTTHAARLQLAGSFCAVVVLALLGKPVLAVFGPSFEAGYGALVILAIGQLFSSIFGPVTQLLSMTGHQDNCLLVYSCSLVVLLTLNYVLIGLMGIDGAAMAVVVTLLMQSIWLYRLVVRRLRIYPAAFRLRSRAS